MDDKNNYRCYLPGIIFSALYIFIQFWQQPYEVGGLDAICLDMETDAH